ncbi:MAG: hypothetical protein GY711_22415 [bacterium]|nr:hypothetical protein [bacterium]
MSNIGSSGCDGVSIDLGEIPELFRARGRFPSVLPPGAQCFATARGWLAGQPGETDVSRMTARSLGGGLVQVEPDFSPLGAMTNSVELLLNGQTVFTQGGLSGPGCIFPAPPSCVGTCGCPPGGPDIIAIEFPTPVPVALPGGPSVVADAMIRRPENPTTNIERVTDMELRAICPTPWYFGPFIEVEREEGSMLPTAPLVPTVFWRHT